MTEEEIKQGLIDVLIRKNLVDQALIFELLELLGEDRFYDFITRFAGQTLKMPSIDKLLREYRNELIGRTLDEVDNRFVRKELRAKWDLTSANLSMIYSKYKRDVETGEFDPEIQSHEIMIKKIKERRRRGEISGERALEGIRTFNEFIAQRKKELEFCLKLAAINYPEGIDSEKNDFFAKALRRIRKQIRDSEAAKVRRKVRNEKRILKEK